jgi:hypothetical protein
MTFSDTLYRGSRVPVTGTDRHPYSSLGCTASALPPGGASPQQLHQVSGSLSTVPEGLGSAEARA